MKNWLKGATVFGLLGFLISSQFFILNMTFPTRRIEYYFIIIVTLLYFCIGSIIGFIIGRGIDKYNSIKCNRKDIINHIEESSKKLNLFFGHFTPRCIKIDMEKINGGCMGFAFYISTGALNRLNEKEIFSIIDHELGHVKEMTTTLNGFIGTLYIISPSMIFLIFYNRAIALFFLLFFLINRLFFVKIQADIKHNSEYFADKISAELGSPSAFISVLNKRTSIDKKEGKFIALFKWILYSNYGTHPLESERIKKLEELK